MTTTVGEMLLAGGSVSGTGTTGVIDGSPTTTPSVGTVNPGVNANANPAGILHSGNVIWGTNSIFSVDLSTTNPGSPVAGTDYDQLQVTGTINLGGATLTGTFGAGISLGDRFTIITATGGVTGQFAEPYGQNVVFIQGQKFSVDYSDSTKVVLQKIRADVSVSMSSSMNPSTYGQNVIFTATVQAEPGAGPIPVGTTVTFTLDGVSYPAIAVSTSGTTVTVQFDPQAALGTVLTPGTHTVSATFNGDEQNFNTGTATLDPPQLVEVPVIEPITQDLNYISPNNSIGVQDTVTFKSLVQKEQLTTNWTLTIKNSGGTTVRVYTGSFVGTGANDLISATWDGKDTGGAFVPDGQYTAVASFIDSFGNTGTTQPATVTVDNTSPTATTPAVANPIIAPGTSSTVPTTVAVSGTIADLNIASYVITVVNSGGTVVRTYSGTASVNPSNIGATWDGKNQSNVIVPDGVYTVTLQSKDLAGNVSTITTNTIVVLTVPPALTVTTNTPTIYGDAITLTSTISVTIPSVAPLLVGNTIQFRNGATVLGTGTISNVGGVYTATLTVPTFNAGTYPNITAAYLGTTNFLPSVSSSFTHVVKPKPITVTADDKTRLYGDPNPPLTYKAVGLTNNDTPATVFTGALATTATILSNVGTYPITVGTLTANSNYTMTFVNGTLTITKAPLTMTIDNATRQVLDPNPVFTAQFTGLKNNDPSSVVTGYTITTPATIDSFVGTYPITVTGTPTAQNYNVTVVNGVLTITRRPDDIGVASSSGSSAQIKRYTTNGQIITTVTPPAGFDFTGGTRVATTDLTGSGYSDTVMGTGPGTRNAVVVMSGKAPFEHILATIYPFEASFTGGVFVSTGFISGNSVPDIIVSPDQSGGPRVQVYRGTDFVKIADFFGIDDPNFRGGVRTAVGDINGDGTGDLVVAAGFGGGPRVAIYDGHAVAVNNPVKVVNDFFAFEPTLRNGAFVTVGDVNGDGFGDLIVGGGPGGGPRVTGFSGKTLTQSQQLDPIVNFFAGDPNSRGGVHLAVKDIDGDNKADLVVGAGDNGGSRVTIYLGKQMLGNPAPNPVNLFDAFGTDVMNGVFVG
ncbi:MAG: MBG domain-containing protein [Gemmataceae bacterium]